LISINDAARMTSTGCPTIEEAEGATRIGKNESSSGKVGRVMFGSSSPRLNQYGWCIPILAFVDFRSVRILLTIRTFAD